jgi:putative Holliday junction resolvase
MPLTPASSLRIARVATVGIDFGARRIGVAVSDSGEIATPHSVVRNEGDVIAKIANLGEQLGADLYVVGIARDAQRFKDFAERLRQRTCKEVVLWDEALTTVEAAEQLRAAGLKRRDAEREIDMQAATVILQSYLDAQDRRVS